MSKRRGRSPIVLAAAGGFLAGVIALAVVMWGFPTSLRPRTPSGQPDDRLVPAEPGAQPPNLGADRPAGDRPPGRPRVIEPVPPGSPTVTMDADPVAELRERKLEVPVRGVARTDLRDTFKETRRSTENHNAIDILAPQSTPVVAIEAGIIAKLFESKAGGTTVYQFDPTTRYAYYYAHLERYADGLREGNRVERGQLLGYVGTSGNAPKDTPHLHFAIFRLTDTKQWWKGAPIDPYQVLR